MIQGLTATILMSILCKQCKSGLDDGAVVCATCGCAVEEPSTPARLIEPLPDDEPAFKYATDSDLIGIGGWLILPSIGLAVAPFLFLHGIYTDLHVLHAGRYQAGLSTHPALAGLILFEAINNSVLLVATLGLNALLYRKKRRFPFYMMLYLGGQFLLQLTDHLMALHFNPQSSWTQVIRGLLGAAIWIPYFLKSRRVEVTFVN
jgi:hypothetical protein